MFSNFLSVFLDIAYIVGVILIVGANVYTDLLRQEVISWVIFLVAYVVGRKCLNEKGWNDLAPFLFSVIMFLGFNVWGVMGIKFLDVISNGDLGLNLESIPYLNWIAYLTIIILALRASKMNIELLENDK